MDTLLDYLFIPEVDRTAPKFRFAKFNRTSAWHKRQSAKRKGRKINKLRHKNR